MDTYIAITTTNPQHGYNEVCRGNNRDAVRTEAEKIIGDIRTEYGTDIYAETKHRNLMVVSKTQAKKYGINDSFNP